MRAAYPGAQARERESREASRNILACDMYQRARVVGGYIPMKHEADITPVLRDMLASGRRLCLPLCGERPHMTFHLVSSLNDLIPGAYGIPEPRHDTPVVPVSSIDLLLTPLEAVDPSGMRLGKGGGYYDCLLSQGGVTSLGCALTWQWTEHVPSDEWDVPLTACADARGVVIFGR